MVHYVRLLRTPQVSDLAKKGFSVTAVATITTDLGDSFYSKDIELIARLVDATRSGEILHSQSIAWQNGFRAVKLKLQCHAKYSSRLVCLQITTGHSTSIVATYEIPEVLDVWSEKFSLRNGALTESYVERRLCIDGTCTVRQWEETGDSIARHIWDASLGFILLLQLMFARGSQTGLPHVQHFLTANSSSRLNVLEVGAGCGIVGIAFAQLRKSCVNLTDLEDAQDILQRNVDVALPLPGSTIHRQVLEWGPGIATISDPKFDLVLVSDCIYNPDSSLLLVDTLLEVSKHNPKIFILVGFKRRHDADDLFFKQMRETGFVVAEECTVPLPHSMTDYDSNIPEIELFVYQPASISH